MFQLKKYLLILLLILITNCTCASDSSRLQIRYDSLVNVYEITNIKNDIANALLLLDSKRENLEEKDSNLNRSVSYFQNIMTIFGILLAAVSIFSWLNIRQRFNLMMSEIKTELKDINLHKVAVLTESTENIKDLRSKKLEAVEAYESIKETVKEILEAKSHVTNIVTPSIEKEIVSSVEKSINSATKDGITEFYTNKYMMAINSAFDQKNWSAVSTIFDLYIQYDESPNHEIYYKSGYSLYMQGEYYRARDQFNKALLKNESFCEALWGLLMCLEKMGADIKKKEEIQKKISTLPNCSKPLEYE